MARTTAKPTAGAAVTTPAQLERLGEHLHKLRLQKSAERLEAMLQHAAAEDLPTACRRAFKSDHLCALNFDQGLKPPVIGMAVDKCSVFSKFGVSSGLV